VANTLPGVGSGVAIRAPRLPWYPPEDVVGVSMYWWIYLAGNLNADRNAAVSRYIRRRGDANVGTELRELVRRGRVRLIPQRVIGARGRDVTLADGAAVAVTSVLWCTGFRPDTAWIDIPGAIGSHGAPLHDGAPHRCAGCTGWGCPGRPGSTPRSSTVSTATPAVPRVAPLRGWPATPACRRSRSPARCSAPREREMA